MTEVDRLGRSGRQDARGDVVARVDSEVGEADRLHARDSLDFPDEHLASRKKLPATDIFDLQDVVAPEAGIDGARVDGLRIDDGRADDEAGRDRELKHDERGAKPPRAGRFGRRPVRLQHLRGLEAGDEDRRIETADDPDEKRQRDRREQDPALPDIVERDVGIEEGGEWPDQQLNLGEREQHRSR